MISLTYNKYKIHADGLFYFALICSIVPLWLSKYPPMVDLPQHAAQINIINGLLNDNNLFLQNYSINWFTPYLFGYLSIYILYLILPLLTAIKIVLTISLSAIPIICGKIFKQLELPEEIRWLLLPILFTYSFYWGFLNFIVATPLGLLLVLYTIKYNNKPSLKKAIYIAIGSLGLFFAHTLVLIFYSFISLSYLLGANYKNPKKFIIKALPYVVPLPIMLLWMSNTQSNEIQTNSFYIFDFGVNRLKIIYSDLSNHLAGMPGVVVFSLLFFAPVITESKFNSNTKYWMPFICGSIFYFGFPFHMFGTGYLYPRFAILLFPFWLILWWPKKIINKKFKTTIVILVFITAFINVYRFVSFDKETRDFDKVISKIEPNQSMLCFIEERNSNSIVYPVLLEHLYPTFQYPFFLHFGAWYQALDGGLVDFSFAHFFPEMARFLPNKKSSIIMGFEWNPRQFNWELYRGYKYKYFLISALKDVSFIYFEDKVDSVVLKSNYGNWWLYENKNYKR